MKIRNNHEEQLTRKGVIIIKSYQVPPDLSEKEKVVGGILTIGQTGWLALSGLFLAIGISVCQTLLAPLGQPTVTIISIFFGLLLGGPILPFAFVKVKEVSLFRYLILKRQFKKMNKEYPFIRNTTTGGL